VMVFHGELSKGENGNTQHGGNISRHQRRILAIHRTASDIAGESTRRTRQRDAAAAPVSVCLACTHTASTSRRPTTHRASSLRHMTINDVISSRPAASPQRRHLFSRRSSGPHGLYSSSVDSHVTAALTQTARTL